MLDIGNYDLIPFIKARSGCDFHRVHVPFVEMGFDPYNISSFTTEQQVWQAAKLVTFNRDPGFPMKTLLEARKRYGFKICIDIDDWLELPPSHMLYPSWSRKNVAGIYRELLPKMDAVTVTTERLAVKFRSMNPNVYVIPNAIPFDSDNQVSRQFRFNGYGKHLDTRFIWAGGSTHFRDLRSILPGVFRAFPTLNFTMAGYNGADLSSRSHWDKMERLCSNNGNNPNYRRIKTMPVNSYANALDNYDVSLAPLDMAEPWNQYKSSLKCYEAGAKKLACIASACPPYTDDLPDNVVTFCKTSRDWQEAIRKHKDIAFAREQGQKLYDWVRSNRNIIQANEYRLQVYNAIHDGLRPGDLPTHEQQLKQYHLQAA